MLTRRSFFSNVLAGLAGLAVPVAFLPLATKPKAKAVNNSEEPPLKWMSAGSVRKLEWDHVKDEPIIPDFVDASTPCHQHILIYLDGTEVCHATGLVKNACRETDGSGTVEFFIATRNTVGVKGRIPNWLMSAWETMPKGNDFERKRRLLTSKSYGQVRFEWSPDFKAELAKMKALWAI